MPNSSRSPNRSAQPGLVAAGQQPVDLGPGRRIGVLVPPRLRGADERLVVEAHRSPATATRRSAIRSVAALPGGEDLGVVEGLGAQAGGEVGDERQGEHLGAGLAGGDHFVHRRHPDEVAAEGPVGTDLRRCLVVGSRDRGVDTLGEVGVVLPGQGAEARGVGVGQIGEPGAPLRAGRRLGPRQR